jgi:hypothetical protein
MMEELRCSKTLVLTRATRRNIPEDGILHSSRRENLKSYTIIINILAECRLLRCYAVWQPTHAVFLRSVRRSLVTANVVPNSPILVTSMMEALSSSGTSDLIRATRRNIPEDAIRLSHRRENLKSYIIHVTGSNTIRNNKFRRRYLRELKYLFC